MIMLIGSLLMSRIITEVLNAMIRASGSAEVVLKVLVIIRQIRVISGQKFDFSSTIPNKFTKFTA